MSNVEIINRVRCELGAKGLIKTTVKDGVNTPAEGIYTKNAWKKRGYRVDESEAPIAVIPIWVFCRRKDDKHGMCRVRAHFYKASQVVAI